MKAISSRKTTRLLLVILTIMLSFGFIVTVNAADSKTIPVDISIWMKITNFDQSKKMVNYELSVFVEGLTDNTSDISIGIPGWSITCEPQKIETGWRYYCEFEPISTKISGKGEAFPFDNYTLTIPVTLSHGLFSFDRDVYVYDLSTVNHSIYFSGPESESLEDNWKTYNRDLPVKTTKDTISIDFIRNDDKIVLYLLEFAIPIVACYFLVGASLLLKPESLSERLRIYVSIFLFCPSFLFAIQSYLPYHTSFTFPEFLLVNLIITTSILGIFSTVGNVKNQYKNTKKPNNFKIRTWDFWGTIFSFLFFLILYYAVFFSNFEYFFNFSMITNNFNHIGLFSYLVLPAFFFWIPVVFSKEEYREQYTKISWDFFKFLLFATIIYGVMFFVLTMLQIYIYEIFPIIAFVFGIIIRLHQQDTIKSTILAPLSGIVGMFFTPIILCVFIYLISGKYIHEIMVFSGGFNYVFGLFALLGALTSSFLIKVFRVAVLKRFTKK